MDFLNEEELDAEIEALHKALGINHEQFPHPETGEIIKPGNGTVEKIDRKRCIDVIDDKAEYVEDEWRDLSGEESGEIPAAGRD